MQAASASAGMCRPLPCNQSCEAPAAGGSRPVAACDAALVGIGGRDLTQGVAHHLPVLALRHRLIVSQPHALRGCMQASPSECADILVNEQIAAEFNGPPCKICRVLSLPVVLLCHCDSCRNHSAIMGDDLRLSC